MGKGLTKFVGEIPYMWDIVSINTPVLLGEELDNQFMHSIVAKIIFSTKYRHFSLDEYCLVTSTLNCLG